MKDYSFYLKLIIAEIFIGLFLLSSASAQQGSVVRTTQMLQLGDTAVKINVYEQKGDRITFFAPHYTEQIGTTIAKEFVGNNGGRLIEIESLNETAQPSRYLKFKQQDNSYSVDPNRIFTDNGRLCNGLAPEINLLVKAFADNLLKIIFPPNGNKLRSGERFLVAVHNNANVDDPSRTDEDKAKDLTAYSFARDGKFSVESFAAQADGVYLSNVEFDADNFFFLSTPKYLSFFAERGFNTVVQKPAAKLQDKNCHVDDGSLSVFAGQSNIPYVNIEADIVTGSYRQRQMISAVYDLLKDPSARRAELDTESKSEEAGVK